MKNSGSYSGNFAVREKSSIEHSGVFALHSFEPGETITFLEGVEVEQRTRISIEVEGRHIDPTGGLEFLNHSCDANSFVNNSRYLIASKHIDEGDEITINYKETEKELCCPFQCNCGSPNCMGWVK